MSDSYQSSESADVHSPSGGRSRRYVYLLEHIVDLQERRTVWSVEGRIRDIAQDDSSLFVLTVAGEVVARRLDNGEQVWSQTTWPAADSVFEAGSYVYVLGSDGRIDRFRKTDGDPQHTWLALPNFGERKGFRVSTGGTVAIAYATHLQLFDEKTPGGHQISCDGKPQTGPDFEQVIATVEGRANGFGETETAPSVHLLGDGFLLVRMLTTGTELRNIAADGTVLWERLLPMPGLNPLQIAYLDENRICLHGTRFEPTTIVLDSRSGRDMTRLSVHSEEALLGQEPGTLLAIEDEALVARDLEGSIRWRLRDFAPGWEPNHNISSRIVDGLLVVAWYNTIGANMRLMGIDLKNGKPHWSKDVAIQVDKQQPFYHNLVTLESSSKQLIVTFDQASGLTVLIFDSSGTEWFRQTKEWQDPVP